ncbi:MAG TPA: hypothetical protein ENK18_09655 [Deltaproteobacteria bacterium]|nr:hypothetical protein [Deltaproteobacteria bacterium]
MVGSLSMVPSDYRLDHVTARLIERLEGARRTFGDDERAARAAFEETASAHIEAVIAEYRALAFEEPSAHAAFLEREVLQTALPRYVRLAVQMNRAEAEGFGFGWLAEPLGRFALVGVAAVGLLLMVRLAAAPLMWPLLLFDLSLPLWPSIGAWLGGRRYTNQVVQIVDDMARIQDSEGLYLSDAQREAMAELGAPSTPTREDP